MGKITRLVLCGSAGVGKTSFMKQMLHTEEQLVYPTIEDTYMIQVDTERGVKETVKVIDTRGDLWSSAATFPSHYFNFADGFVLMYSNTDPESFRCVESIKKELDRARDKKDVFVVVVATKTDLKSQRDVDTKVVSTWVAKEKVKRFETSIFNKKRLPEALIYICSKMTQPASKTTLLGSSRRLLKQQSSDA